MAERVTPRQIKKTNRQLIFDYLYRNERVSQQDIAYALQLSRPTVLSNLTQLEAEGLVCKSGQLASDQVGRKAVGYSVVGDCRVALGVELMRREVKMIAVDLYGRKLDRMTLDIQYEDTPRYYDAVSEAIQNFITAHGFHGTQLLGVGIAVPGLVTSDGTTIVYGAILGNTGLSVNVFSSRLPYPCRFLHDAESAALTELWSSPDLSNAIYVSLSRHLGGAMITNGQVRSGKHGHNATFEHISVKPQGALCYCGRRGCAETLCSMKALLGDEAPEAFFDAVQRGEAEAAERWRTYLGHLASLIGTLHLVRDVDVILGGQLAAFLTAEDLRFLYDQIRPSSPFHDGDDYIVIGKMPRHSITIGSALPYIRQYLEDIGETE